MLQLYIRFGKIKRLHFLSALFGLITLMIPVRWPSFVYPCLTSKEQVKQVEQRLFSGQETLRQEAMKREQHLSDLQDSFIGMAPFSCVVGGSF